MEARPKVVVLNPRPVTAGLAHPAPPLRFTVLVTYPHTEHVSRTRFVTAEAARAFARAMCNNGARATIVDTISRYPVSLS